MASHIAHLLFAEESATRAGMSLDRTVPLYVLGAQGPDLFLHSQRRKPRAIQYGGLFHRKGFGSLVARLAEGSRDATAYAAGFLTHIVLDRVSHPFINYFAGWWDRDRPETKAYQQMHPFLERLIDVELLQRREGIHPKEIAFHRLVDCGSELPESFLRELCDALRKSVDSAARDQELRERVRNAYADSRGYYRHTSGVDEAYLREARRREETGEISDRWLSLVHPPSLPYELDVLNLSHRKWCHPCDSTLDSQDSFLDLWQRGVPQAASLLETLSEGDTVKLEREIGDRNLNDGIYGATPCRRRHMGPLPLRELYDQIRKGAGS
ncbi:MAG: zinc dependent phospholipase C family protein [Alkalispirochaetaceae bacterium]